MFLAKPGKYDACGIFTEGHFFMPVGYLGYDFFSGFHPQFTLTGLRSLKIVDEMRLCRNVLS